MENQFDGMTDIPFTYEEFEQTRSKLIEDVNTLMTDDDKRFRVSFEKGLAEPAPSRNPAGNHSTHIYSFLRPPML